jgi:hypothetical protein
MERADELRLKVGALLVPTWLTFVIVLFVSKEILDEPGGDVTWQGWAWSFVIAAVAALLVLLIVTVVQKDD